MLPGVSLCYNNQKDNQSTYQVIVSLQSQLTLHGRFSNIFPKLLVSDALPMAPGFPPAERLQGLVSLCILATSGGDTKRATKNG